MMTTSPADRGENRELRELDERLRTAWEDYRSSISTLEGAEYEELEPDAWERLQRALHDLADERERLVSTR
jgi:signal transduction histidine kinase